MLLVPGCGWKIKPPLSFIASASARGNPAVVDKPAGTQPGDIMIAVIGRSSAGAGVPTTPSGWTLLVSASGNSPFVYYKVDAGSEPSTYTWSGSGGLAVVTLTYRNGGVGVAGTVSSNSTAPGITPAAIGTLLAIYYGVNNLTISSPPSGMTERGTALGSAPVLAVYDLDNVGPSPTGDKAITWAGGGTQKSVLCHIEQA